MPQRYKFNLNPYSDWRMSRCPFCDKLTFPRKFAFFIHVKEFGGMTLGKTSRYCSHCEFIIIHQDELEMELSIAFTNLKRPEVLGSPYLVVGTVDKKYWKGAVAGEAATIQGTLARLADFKKVHFFKYEPARWVPKDQAGT